jgi:hypothetical protein
VSQSSHILHDDVVGAQAIRGDEQDRVLIHAINVANFSAGKKREIWAVARQQRRRHFRFDVFVTETSPSNSQQFQKIYRFMMLRIFFFAKRFNLRALVMTWTISAFFSFSAFFFWRSLRVSIAT